MPASSDLLLRVNGIQAAYGAEFGMASPRADEVRACDPYRQANVSYSLLQMQGDRLLRHTLIDVGMGVVPSLLELEQQFGVHVVHDVLISHPHFDHFAGLHWLSECIARNGRQQQPRPLPVYATPACWQAGPDRVFSAMSKWNADRVEHRALAPAVPIDLGALRITPFAVDHGPTAPGAVGFVAQHGERKVVMTCDFLRIPDPQAPLLQRPQVCLMEANSWHPAPQTNHQSIREGLKLIELWQPASVYLIHYSGAADWDYPQEEIHEPMKLSTLSEKLRGLGMQCPIEPARHGMIFGRDEPWPG